MNGRRSRAGEWRAAVAMGRFAVGAVVMLMFAGCAASASPAPGAGATPGPGASASASPVSTAPLGQAQLKTLLIDRFGPLWYCDPDFFPVAREDEGALAVSRWVDVAADAASVAVIVTHLGLSLPASGAAPTDAQKLAIYREWKVLRAIGLDPVSADRFAFDYLAQPAGGGQAGAQGTRSKGTIAERGAITVQSSTAAPQPNCPICLARGQRIETPLGPVAVEALRPGDPVWSLGADGRRIGASVIALGSTPVPAGHQVVRLLLADGRMLLASPGHPLADGRPLGGVRPGDVVGGALVLAADLVPYAGSETFDLLTSGPTGTYSVDGIWLGSTLRR